MTELRKRMIESLQLRGLSLSELKKPTFAPSGNWLSIIRSRLI
jgi:hypothetical protein